MRNAADLIQKVPAELKARPQWVCWKHLVRRGQPAKVPFDPKTKRQASTTDPSNWSTLEEAAVVWEKHPDLVGIGFVFSPDDPFCGVDLDQCIDVDGNMAPTAQEIITRLDSYTEVSPSGKGVKVFLKGRKPVGAGCKSKEIPGYKETEVYDQKRYFTFTGAHLSDTPTTIVESQGALDELCHRLWPKTKPPEPEALSQPSAQGSALDECSPELISRPGYPGSDEQLLEAAFAAKNGEKFERLWLGDTSAYGDDDSAADQALCGMLAFWTGKDAERINRLFKKSRLYREKWERADYRERTIQRAIEKCTEVYTPKRKHSGGGDVPQVAVALGSRDPESNRLVLSPSKTLPTAEAFVREFYTHPQGLNLRAYAGLMMAWRNNRYSEIEDESIKHQLQPWLHEALQYIWDREQKVFVLAPFCSNPGTVKSALDSVRTLTHLPASITPPVWLDGRSNPNPLELLCGATRNLHIPTGDQMEATPMLFNLNSLPFNYDPDAPTPVRWIEFLEETLSCDAQAIELLQEWFGYCLTADTRQQKMLLLVGPKRCGKGTIGRVIAKLVGMENVCGPTISGLAGPFGLQPLVGKALSVVSDARFTGEAMKTVVERLLCISGEDTLTIDRKHLPSVTMKLPTRLMFLTNELPRLADSSGALAGRFLIIRFTRSFFGQEDLGLGEKLDREMSGILNWALDGWRRLHERGRFVEPESAQDARGQLEDLTSPVGMFIRERCVLGALYRANADTLYEAWTRWRIEEGWNAGTTKVLFGRELSAACPQVVKRRNRDDGAYYEGIALAEAASPPTDMPPVLSAQRIAPS